VGTRNGVDDVDSARIRLVVVTRLRIVARTMARAAKKTSGGTKSVEVIDLLRELLKRGDNDGVIELVTKLMATHEDQLRSMFERARKQSTKNEGTTSAQLSFLVDELKKMAAESPDDANAKLAAVAPVPPSAMGPKYGPSRRRRVVGPCRTCRTSTTSSRCPTTSARVRNAAARASASATRPHMCSTSSRRARSFATIGARSSHANSAMAA
jgi:hypothetical protein